MFVPPRVDCAVDDAPRASVPDLPDLQSTVPAWQLYAFGWQAYAEDVLGQRVDTAKCMAKLREIGVIK